MLAVTKAALNLTEPQYWVKFVYKYGVTKVGEKKGLKSSSDEGVGLGSTIPFVQSTKPALPTSPQPTPLLRKRNQRGNMHMRTDGVATALQTNVELKKMRPNRKV